MRLGRSMGLSRGLDSRAMDEQAEDNVLEGTRLHELGEKFVSDKAKIEAEIEKVENSGISEQDKKKLIDQLESALSYLQDQYDLEVTEERERLQQELESQILDMQDAADEMEKQADSLREVHMEAASVDTSAAADAADEKKEEFENMKREYAEKLKLQMEQAEMQQRNIRNRRITGR